MSVAVKPSDDFIPVQDSTMDEALHSYARCLAGNELLQLQKVTQGRCADRILLKPLSVPSFADCTISARYGEPFLARDH